MSVEIDRLRVTLEANFARYNADMARAQATTNQRLAAIEARYAQWTSRLKMSASTAAMGIGSALGGVSAMLGTHAIIEYADAWNRVARSIPASQQAIGVALRSASDLTDLANDARVDLEAYSKLYIRTSAAIRDYGYEAGTAEKVTSTLSKALKIGGAAASEQASVLLQFSQALNKGKLDGDEFRSVMENAVIVQELLAERLGVSKGEIIKLAAEGKLRIPDLVGSLVDGGAKIERIFKQMPTTIDEAFVVLRNNIVRYIGRVDEASGASQSLVSILASLSRNIDTVANGAFTLGAALLAAFGGGSLRAIIAVASRLATIPALLAGGSAAALSFGADLTLDFGRLNNALSQGIDGADALRYAMDDASLGATTVSDQFRGLSRVLAGDLLDAIGEISKALTGSSVTWEDLANYAGIAAFSMIASFKAMYIGLRGVLHSIAPAGEVAFKSLTAAVMGEIAKIVDAFAEGVNSIIAIANKIPGVKIDFIVAPDLRAGADAALEAAKAELDRISKETRERAVAAFDFTAFTGRIQAEADKIAIDRMAKQWKPVENFDEKKNKPPPDTDAKSEARFARQMAQAESRLRLAQLEAKTIGQTTVAIERQRMVEEILNKARETGVTVQLEQHAAILALADATARASVAAEHLKNVQEAREAGANIQREIELVGKYGFELAYARNQQDLLNKAKKLGIELTPERLAEIDHVARQNAALEYTLEIMRDIEATSKDAIKGFISDMREGKSAAEALGNALNRLADKFIDAGVDSLVGSLLGLGGSKTDLFSSLLGGVKLFANGGIAAHGRPVPLPRFAKGGVSSSAAIFGEAGPEAAVPLPDGRRIPVDLRIPTSVPSPVASGPASVTIAPVFNVQNGTAEGIDKLKGEIVPLIRQVAQSEVATMFDRSAKFRRR